jgi:hypothetical protein
MMCLIVMENLFVQKEAGIPKKIIKVEDIPGLSKFYNSSSLVSICFFIFGT